MKSLVIAHGEDLDGILSHVLLDSYFKGNAHHIFVRYDSLVHDFNDLLDYEFSNIGIADLSLNQSIVSVIEKLREKNKRDIFWVDHHQGTKEKINFLNENNIKLYYSDQDCSTMQIYKLFFLDSIYAKGLAEMAQVSDNLSSYGIQNLEIAKKLEKLISLANYKNDKDELWNITKALGRLVYSEKKVLKVFEEEKVQEYDYLEQLAFQQIDKNRVVERIGNYNFLFSRVSPIIASKKATKYLMEKYSSEADVFVSLFEVPSKSHLLMVKDDVNLNAVQLCKSMGGGGRGNGGGFSLDEGINEQNYLRIRREIINNIEEYIKSN